MFVHRLKLRAPQLLPTWIERGASSGAAVCCIVAGPGYGKTVLAAQIYHRAAPPKFWFTLDLGDADPAVFAAHLAAMLDPGGGGGAPGAPGLESPKELAGRLADAARRVRPQPLFVFDDVHLVAGTAGSRLLADFVARTRPAGCRFVFCGRSLPLELDLCDDPGARVGAQALAFDGAESRAFLRTAFPEAGDAALERLTAMVEGWPAGLALVASSPSLAADAAPVGLAADRDDATRRLLFDYLAAEVLAGFTDGERRFLLETAVLEELDPAVCAEVTRNPSAAGVLAALAARGVFIVRRSADAYSSHQLFGDFLSETLARTYPAEAVAELHRRAARALAARGDRDGFIAHLMFAGDVDEGTAALETSVFAMLRAGQLSTAGALLAQAGEARVAASPVLLMARGRLAQLSGDFDAALGTLERAMTNAEERRAYDLVAEGVRFASMILASRGEFERLLALVDRTLRFGTQLSPAGRAALEATRGAAYLDINRPDDALAVFRDVMPSLVASGDLALQGVVLHNTGVAQVRRGEPYAALAMYERALGYKRAAGQRLSALVTLGNQIVVLRLVGDLDEAERLLREFSNEAAEVGNEAIAASVLENEGAIAFARGNAAEALRSFRAAERRCDPGDVLALPGILQQSAQTSLALGNVSEADDACARAAALLRGTDRSQQLAEILTTRAEAALAQRAYRLAFDTLREALELCERGVDAVVEASIKVELALLAVRLAPLLPPETTGADDVARAAAAGALALIHQRNYRFLFRTKARTFAALRPQLRRWGIAAGVDPGGGEAASQLRLELLGPFRVFVRGKPIAPEAWKRRKARDIFAYLAAHRGRSVPRARLVDAFWPDADADAAHESLRVTITAIRKAAGDVVKFEADGYRFVPPTDTLVDVDAFDEAIEGARKAVARGDGDAARGAYLAAAGLYRGDFLNDLDEGAWQWRERERLRAACLEALRALAYDETLGEVLREKMLDRLLELAPFDIEAVRRKLDAFAARSLLSEALHDYDRWRERYRATIGDEPPNVWMPPAAKLSARP